jgi:predicted DsbA family dithiol-disulfide isomerase
MAIHISITSDFICPWCFIGERRLAKAIGALPSATEIELSWRPFELNPDMPSEGMDRKAYRARKFGSWERSRMLDGQIVAAARGDDIAFNHSAMEKTPNTFLAHRLMRLAQRHGLATAMAKAVFSGYFEHGRDIGDIHTLSDIAFETGLARTEAESFLAGDDGAADVRAAEHEGQLSGIRGVPLFNIGGEIVSGAQSVAIFTAALLRAGEQDAAYRAGAGSLA